MAGAGGGELISGRSSNMNKTLEINKSLAGKYKQVGIFCKAQRMREEVETGPSYGGP